VSKKNLAHLAQNALQVRVSGSNRTFLRACLMSELSRYDAARRALAEARDLSEVKDVVDKAAALKEYARRANDRELELNAAELRFRAERRLGEMITSLELTAGRPKRNGFSKNLFPEGTNKPSVSLPTLAEMGIDKNLANRARKLALIKDADFEGRIAECRERALQSKARIVFNLLPPDREATCDVGCGDVALPPKQYGTILLDPIWLSSESSEIAESSTELSRTKLQIEVLRKLDLRKIGANDCILFVWATIENLTAVSTLMARWGFKYVSHCVWDKGSTGSGSPFSEAHELLLLGRRGNVIIPNDAPWSSLIHDPIPRISGKPEWQYQLAEWACPDLTKLDITGSSRRPGWDVWPIYDRSREGKNGGNEAAGPSNRETTLSDGDGLDIPEFLRRKHPDCMFGEIEHG
jgi:N6-adenosine-specific RNA methylase IME4